MNVCQAVSYRIKALLKEKEMNQYQLEKASGILHGTMDCIVKVKNKTVTLSTIMMIARGFNMSFIEFLNDDIFLSDELEIE